MPNQKSSGLAAVMFFFIMGLGQIYNGQIAKGLGLIVAEIVLWTLTLFTLGFAGLILLPLWIWNIYDAYKTAEAINARASSAE